MPASKEVTATQHSPVIHVILPVHNRVNVTKKFIACLSAQIYDNFQLFLVDDGCHDGTVEYVLQKIPNTCVLHGNGNLWWAGALQKAYKHLTKTGVAESDIIWIANDDIVFEDDYFSKVIRDPLLTDNSLVVSPGACLATNFVEYGFRIKWDTLEISQLPDRNCPDALTTRGLYMRYSVYREIGGFHRQLLPHYLSDLEYTCRAKRKGFALRVSNSTEIRVDRSTTGIHRPNEIKLVEFLYNNLVSKRTAYNATHWMAFVALAAPPKHKFKAMLIVAQRFLVKLYRFIRK